MAGEANKRHNAMELRILSFPQDRIELSQHCTDHDALPVEFISIKNPALNKLRHQWGFWHSVFQFNPRRTKCSQH